LTAWPDVPTTVVVAVADQVVAPDRLRARAAAMPGVRVVELQGGHFPMLVRPAELADVLESAAAGDPGNDPGNDAGGHRVR
jgi:pimeloyl-ACP methyl ester carboxylesterase